MANFSASQYPSVVSDSEAATLLPALIRVLHGTLEASAYERMRAQEAASILTAALEGLQKNKVVRLDLYLHLRGFGGEYMARRLKDVTITDLDQLTATAASVTDELGLTTPGQQVEVGYEDAAIGEAVLLDDITDLPVKTREGGGGAFAAVHVSRRPAPPVGRLEAAHRGGRG